MKKSSLQKPTLRSNVAPLDIKTDCFVCGRDGKGHYGDMLSRANKKSEKIWKDVLSAATERKDEIVLDRLHINAEVKTKVLLYHIKSCYQLYINKRNINAALAKTVVPDFPDDKRDETSQGEVATYDQCAAALCREISNPLLDNEEVLRLDDVRNRYIELLTEGGINAEVAQSTSNSLVKSKLTNTFGDQITFFHRNGRSDFFCSVGISIERFKEQTEALVPSSSFQEPPVCDDDQIIREAVRIIRAEIQKIPETTEYPNPDEVSVDDSEAMLPTKLANMIQLLVDAPWTTKPLHQTMYPSYQMKLPDAGTLQYLSQFCIAREESVLRWYCHLFNSA